MSAYTDFLKDPDQSARRRELEVFIGPNAASYLKTYDMMQAATNRVPGERRAVAFSFNFNVMAFLLGPCWFFYRRMWLYAWLIVVLEVGAGLIQVVLPHLHIPQGAWIGLGAGLAAAARYFYVPYAIHRITSLRQAGHADEQTLRAKGGVSPIAGWVSSLVLVALGVLVVVTAMAAMKAGLPPPT